MPRRGSRRSRPRSSPPCGRRSPPRHLAEGHGHAAPRGPATLWRWSRRRWWIALGSLLVVAAVGLGLGFGLTRDHAASEAGLMSGQVTWTELKPHGHAALCSLRPGDGPGSDQRTADHVRRIRRADGGALSTTPGPTIPLPTPGRSSSPQARCLRARLPARWLTIRPPAG